MVEYAQHVVSQGLTCHTGEKQKEEGEEQKNKQRETGQQRKTGGDGDESAGKSICSSLVTGVGSPEPM